jgi:hypothetical protein
LSAQTLSSDRIENGLSPSPLGMQCRQRSSQVRPPSSAMAYTVPAPGVAAASRITIMP